MTPLAPSAAPAFAAHVPNNIEAATTIAPSVIFMCDPPAVPVDSATDRRLTAVLTQDSIPKLGRTRHGDYWSGSCTPSARVTSEDTGQVPLQHRRGRRYSRWRAPCDCFQSICEVWCYPSDTANKDSCSPRHTPSGHFQNTHWRLCKGRALLFQRRFVGREH